MKNRDEELIKIMGAKFLALRLASGMTQLDVSKAMNTGRPTIANIESGNQLLTPVMISKAVYLFKCRFEDLFPSANEHRPYLKEIKMSLELKRLAKIKKLELDIEKLKQGIDIPVDIHNPRTVLGQPIVNPPIV